MKNEHRSTRERRFSPVLEIADFELEQVIGGKAAASQAEDLALPDNSLPIKAAPIQLPKWLIQHLKDHPLVYEDSSSEERRH